MNYYERHLGDYARDTAHLSLLEHGVYNVLLDRYYITEQPIPADQAHRIARAKTKDERAAVDAVLAEFFTLEAGCYRQGRVESEIAAAQVRINAARENGRTGGRPKRNPMLPPIETQQKPTGLSLGSENITQTKALQSPVSSLQRESENKPARTARGSRLSDDFRPDLEYARAQIPDMDADAEFQRFADYWRAKAGAAGCKLDWQATWRNWIRSAKDSGRYAHKAASRLPPGVVMR